MKQPVPFTPQLGRWVLVASILASSMAFIDLSALHVALPALQVDLGATGTQLLWIVNSYALMLAALLLVSGSLGDNLGRRRVFMVGIALFTAASVGCGLAPTTRWLITLRLLQGIGAAVMVPGSLSLITALFPIDKQGAAIGTWSAASALVTVAGPLLGGALAYWDMWRLLFFINVPLGLVAMYALWHVPETYGEGVSERIDYVGAAMATVGLAAVTYGFLAVPEVGFDHWTVAITLVGGVFLLVGFVWWQKKISYPMLPLHLFESRTFSGANLLTLFLYGAMNAFSFFLSLNLVQIQGYTPLNAGFVFLPFALVMVVLSRWAGSLADRFGPRPLLTFGPALAGFGFWWLSYIGLTAGVSEMATTFLPGVLLFGLGMSLTVAPLTTAVMTAVPRRYAGTASGVNNAVSRTAGVLAVAIVGAIGVVLFINQLGTLTAGLALPAEAREQLSRNAVELAETKIPPSVTGEQREAVAYAVDLAFVEMHQMVMRICMVLSWLSAAVAYWLIEPKQELRQPPDRRTEANSMHVH